MTVTGAAAKKAENPVEEYIQALLASPRLGPQVVHHQVIPAKKARRAKPARPWPAAMRDLIGSLGLKGLYAHQSQAIDLVRAGRHVIVATPTASGKTLIYNLPVLEQIEADPASRALYLFPLKALAQDQLRTFQELISKWPDEDVQPRAAIYDGDTTVYRRKRLRDVPPNVLLTNPEMLHLSLLPHHERWATFWSGLTHVVVDEVHTYRGIFGSHMAWVFRRMGRVCARYGVRPTFVLCSATVGNPVELAENLTGCNVEAVTEGWAPQGKRHVLFVNPEDGAAQTAILLLQAALPRGLRTIVYTQSRKLTELIALWAGQRSGELADRISAYRAGFLPEERREIEAKLSSGELLAVISTSALELGIDVGALDLCLLVGYPGTVMATWQRSGRVGRSLRDSALVLIAQQDALDQHFMRHPTDFFQRPPEPAVLNPENPTLTARHLVCAGAEIPLRTNEPVMAGAHVQRAVAQLEAEGKLLRSAEGHELYAARRTPHRDLNLRGTGRSFRIEAIETGETVGEIDDFRAYRETHKGAIYLHRGETFLVEDLDLATRTARVRTAKVDYFTRVRGQKATEILEVLAEQSVWGTRVFHGRLRVADQVTGYEQRMIRGQRLITVVPLDLPPQIFETEGLWIEIPRAVQAAAEDAYHHFMGGIHAMEHAAIGILPLLVLTDRNDLGGISTPMHPHVGRAAVFIYDGVPGGIGLSRQAFEQSDELLERTLEVIRNCPCEVGCPSCVHSPKCGSGNRPIDKAAALFLLSAMRKLKDKGKKAKSTRPRASSVALEDGESTSEKPLPSAVHRTSSRSGSRARTESQESEPPSPGIHYGVFDLETQRSAEEVGGWHRADLMGISCAVLYDAREDAFLEFQEAKIPEFIERLASLELIVGFNCKRFDYNVLRGYDDFDFRGLPTLDILEEVYSRLGYRLSLDHLAGVTLGRKKSADGLAALRWWKEGRIDEILAYCREDVAITRELFLYGLREGHLLFRNKAGKTVCLPVSWKAQR